MKFTALFSLLAIVLGSIAYGSFRGEMSSPETVGKLVEETIKPVKIEDDILNFGMNL